MLMLLLIDQKLLNAFTPVTLQELKTALDNAEKDKNVGVIIFIWGRSTELFVLVEI